MKKILIGLMVFSFWFSAFSNVQASYTHILDNAGLMENVWTELWIGRALGTVILRNEDSLIQGKGIYNIKTEVYINYSESNEIILFYPQFGEEEDIEYEKINELLESDIKRILQNSMYDDNNYYLSMDYEIRFLNQDIISVLYKGRDGAASSASHDWSCAMGTTIDIKNARILHLEDIVTDFEELEKLLTEDKFEPVSIWDGVKSDVKLSGKFHGNGRERFMQDLQTYGSGYVEVVEWYTDGNNVIIIYSNPYYEEYAGSKELLEGITNPQFWEMLAESENRRLK